MTTIIINCFEVYNRAFLISVQYMALRAQRMRCTAFLTAHLETPHKPIDMRVFVC